MAERPKLTDPQIELLKRLGRADGRPSTGAHHRTAMALCRLGFAEGDVTYAIGRDYITHRGVYEQFRVPADRPVIRREWIISFDGRQYLASLENSDG